MTPLENLLAEVRAAEAKVNPTDKAKKWTEQHYPFHDDHAVYVDAFLAGYKTRVSRTYVHKLVRLVEVLMEHMRIVHAHNCEGRDPLIMKCNCHAPEQFAVAIAAALAGSEGGGE